MNFRQRIALRRLARDMVVEHRALHPECSDEECAQHVLEEMKATVNVDGIDWEQVLNIIQTIVKLLAMFF